MPAGADQTPKKLYEFGPFRVDPAKELLLRGEATVPLTPKTFQILLVLMRHSKEVVTKDELMKMIWPDTFVEEGNQTSATSSSLVRRRPGRLTSATSSSSAFGVT